MAVETTSRHELACRYGSRSGLPAPHTRGSVMKAPPRPVPANPRTVLTSRAARRRRSGGRYALRSPQPLCEAPRRSCRFRRLRSLERPKFVSSLQGQSPPSRIFRETSDAYAPPRLASCRHCIQFGNSRPQRLCRRRQAPGRRRAAPSQSHAYPPAQADRPATASSTAPRPPTWPKAAGRASLQTCPQSEPRPPGPSPPRRTPRASYPCQEPLTASASAARR